MRFRLRAQSCEANLTIPVLASDFYVIRDEEHSLQWGPFSKTELERDDWKVSLTASNPEAPIGD